MKLNIISSHSQFYFQILQSSTTTKHKHTPTRQHTYNLTNPKSTQLQQTTTQQIQNPLNFYKEPKSQNHQNKNKNIKPKQKKLDLEPPDTPPKLHHHKTNITTTKNTKSNKERGEERDQITPPHPPDRTTTPTTRPDRTTTPPSIHHITETNFHYWCVAYLLSFG